jgi:hypothetical protein
MFCWFLFVKNLNLVGWVAAQQDGGTTNQHGVGPFLGYDAFVQHGSDAGISMGCKDNGNIGPFIIEVHRHLAAVAGGK